MPLRLAARKVPDAVILPVDAPAYNEASAQVMDALRDLASSSRCSAGTRPSSASPPTTRRRSPARAQAAVLEADQAALLGRHR